MKEKKEKKKWFVLYCFLRGFNKSYKKRKILIYKCFYKTFMVRKHLRLGKEKEKEREKKQKKKNTQKVPTLHSGTD